MYQIRVCTQEAKMVNREENNASESSREDEFDDRPRDLQELLLWHQELSGTPSRVGNNPRKRQRIWRRFQEETERLNQPLKWNQLIRCFASHIIKQGYLDSGRWDVDSRSRFRMTCSAEDHFVTSGMTLRSLALCRVHKSLKYTTRLRYDLCFDNYRIQPPILDHLPIPETLIDALKTLWRTCEKHHNMCGPSDLLPNRRVRILKCSHQPEEIRAGDAKCKEPGCALYIFLFNRRSWDDKFSRRTFDWSDLAEDVSDKLGVGCLSAARLLAEAAGFGMQSFTFTE